MLFSKISFAFVLLCMLACSKSADEKYGELVARPEVVLSSFNSYWNYTSKHLKFYESFSALDTSSKIMDKGKFMEMLSSGNFLPLKHVAKDSAVYYQLHRLEPSVSDDIRNVLRDWAYTEFTHYQWEGKTLPGFNYTDLNGKKYNPETVKNKIVVLKFWFVACTPCVAEMPELNRLVARYKDRKDVVFLSLAFDSKEKLEKFLKKIRFDYPVASVQKNYLNEELNIRAYPTHVVMDKKGLVVKMVNKAGALIYVLDQEAKKKIQLSENLFKRL